MITIDQARINIGRGVTSVSETSVFVRYLGDMHSKGTCPEDLDWLTPGGESDD